MDFRLSEADRVLIEHMREFGVKYFNQDTVAQWRSDMGLPDEVVRDFVNLDFNGFGVIHRRDHVRYDMLAQVLVLEELSRISGTTLPFQNDFLQLQILEAFASPAQTDPIRMEYQHTGRLAFAFAVSEPSAGSDTMSMSTSVETRDGKIILNGKKTYVNNGEYSPSILVAAIDKDNVGNDKYPPLSFWLIPHNMPGIRAIPINKIGQSMVPFASVSFDEVEIKPEYRLIGHKGGFRHLFRLLEYGRVFTCASSLGMAQAAMEDAVENARERKAFGVPIGQFQQIEQMLTDMEVSLRTMRAMLYHAAWSIETNHPEKRLAVALMKRYIPKTATQVASDAMQILGGLGYTESARVSTIWEDCRGNQIAEGTDQIMVYIAAPLIMKSYAE